MTWLAATVLERLSQIFGAAADPARATAMAAYMRDRFPFLGLPGPAQRDLTRQVLAGLPAPTEEDLRTVALACWELPEREYQYFACAWLRRHVGRCSADLLPTLGRLIVDRPWWDTVDTLAANVVGPLVTAHPTLVSTMDEWAAGEDMWLARSAILYQLKYKRHTDTARLFRYCLHHAGHPDFFIRKAVGWALREYAKTDPEAVSAFVERHRGQLSGLSIREATKRARTPLTPE
jgi:3-methyladenine DNA glycosylase AlkD